MGIQLYHRPAAGVFPAAQIQIAHTVHADLSQLLRIGADGFHYLVLKAGDAFGVGDGSDHLQGCLFVHLSSPSKRDFPVLYPLKEKIATPHLVQLRPAVGTK